MLNKLRSFLREHDLTGEDTRIVAAVSGGADSVALLFGLFLLRDEMDFELSAAHFNHHLRGEESDRDERFVRDFCDRYGIPLAVGGGEITPGPKGLEAAAREARYAFLKTLPGVIMTAHTANDNAETILMHLIRGTGLKGLGGINPINGRILRPMLNVTRDEVDAFLTEYCVRHIEDSSNGTDQFLRNRIRRNVTPLLVKENPSFALNVSAMAARLRQDEDFIRSQMQPDLPPVSSLREMPGALRCRYLERFLKSNGVPEPEVSHIAAVESLLYADSPSAGADLPGHVRIIRNYDRLTVLHRRQLPDPVQLRPGITDCPQWGIRVTCTADAPTDAAQCFPIQLQGTPQIRSRQPGDTIRLPGGSKTLKKGMIDRKIPASDRPFVPVLADEQGVIWAEHFGFHMNRKSDHPDAVWICIEKI